MEYQQKTQKIINDILNDLNYEIGNSLNFNKYIYCNFDGDRISVCIEANIVDFNLIPDEYIIIDDFDYRVKAKFEPKENCVIIYISGVIFPDKNSEKKDLNDLSYMCKSIYNIISKELIPQLEYCYENGSIRDIDYDILYDNCLNIIQDIIGFKSIL